jgi:hypothetical protein
MPIPDSELNKPSNAHLVRPAADSVYKALHAWRGTPGSQEWWWLVIDQGSQKYTAIRFGTVRDVLARPDLGVTMETHLADLPLRRENPADWAHPLPGAVLPPVVEQDAIGTARALQIVQDNPGRVLIVLRGGRFRGILSAGERVFAFNDKPLIDMIAEFEQKETGSETILLPDSDPSAPADKPAPPEI